MAQLPRHLLVLAILACLAFVPFRGIRASPDPSKNPSNESMLSELCSDIDDQISCRSNIQSRLQNSLHDNAATAALTAAMEASVDEARLAIGRLSRFTSLSGSGGREQIAVEDCKELLDYTVTELAWSMAEMRKLHGRRPAHENLKAWLSAALSNQDTCLEGFEGTNRQAEGFIRGSLRQVTQLVSNVLTLYTKSHIDMKNNTQPAPEIPEWMSEGDYKEFVSSGFPKVDVVVAADGSGQLRSVGEAILQAPSYSSRRYVIHVKKGVYNENVEIKKKKTNIMLVGDGIGVTVITGSRSFMEGWTTFRTPTFAVSGRGFIARGITFRNTAGPHNHQAVALRVDSDQSAFYQCSMEGYQDTLYAHSLRQFYRECNIYGTIDFLFGNGAAVFQNCNLYTRPPLPLQKVTIAAQGRKSPHQSTGFVVQDCYVHSAQPTYLGRPWKEYSRVVYLNTYMGPLVQPRGWLEWYGDFALSTCYFGEYRNYGPGANLSGRVKWPGFHVIRDPSEAASFTAGRFIDGVSWLPATGVKFSAGLTR